MPVNRRLVRPIYWRHDALGRWQTAVESYLAGGHLSEEHAALLRDYIVQWIGSGAWRGAGIPRLLNNAQRARTRTDFDSWFAAALDLGIDPL